MTRNVPGGGGMGMCGPEDPLFTPPLPLARVPFQAKESVHKTPFWENLEIVASTTSIFTQILAHKPPNLEIFSSQAPKFWNFPPTSPPPFSEANVSSQAPHFGNPGRTPLLEKSWVPPPRVTCEPRFQVYSDSIETLRFFCVWTNETSASRNLRSYLVLQRLCNEAALSPGIDAFLY